MQKRKIQVKAQFAGERLDRFLSCHLYGYSRRFLRQIIDEGGVYVNRKRIRKMSFLLSGSELVEIFIPESTQKEKPELSHINLTNRMIMQTNDFIAFDKPAGLDLLATPVSAKTNLHFLLQKEFGNLYAVHRLDKQTSGVVLFTRKKEAAKNISELFRKGEIGKSYLAICKGIPEFRSGKIIGNIAVKKGEQNIYQIVDEGGKYAKTRYRSICSGKDTSFVIVHPLSGRTHQLRLHLPQIGCPILGDKKYGVNMYQETRMLLHAWRLRFRLNNKQYKITAPPDSEFINTINRLLQNY